MVLTFRLNLDFAVNGAVAANGDGRSPIDALPLIDSGSNLGQDLGGSGSPSGACPQPDALRRVFRLIWWDRVAVP